MSFTKPDSIFHTLLREGVIKAGKALDLGCGKGGDAKTFTENGFFVDTVDSKQEIIDGLQ